MSVYRVRRLFPSGFAYVGTQGDIDSVSCPAFKDKECVPYSLSGTTLTIDGKGYAVTSAGLEAGEERWEFVLPVTSVDGAFRLAGYYGLVQGVMPTSRGVEATLSGGSLHATREPATYSAFGFELWPSCSNGCVLDASYSVSGNTFTLTTSAKTKRFFVRRTASELQIGGQWFQSK